MNYDQAVLDFLTLPENLPIALEISRRMAEAKSHLQAQFFHAFAEQMKPRLIEVGAVAKWEVRLPTAQQLAGDWPRCSIAYRSPVSQSQRIDLLLEAGTSASKSPIYYGLHWSRDIRNERERSVLEELMAAIKAMGYVWESSATWPLIIRLNVCIRDDDFLLQFVADPDPIVADICDQVWAFFGQIRAPLEAANAALANLDQAI